MALKLIPPGRRKGKPNRFYIVRGTIGGRRREFSCKTTDPEAARRFKAGLERRLYAGDGDRRVATFAEAAALYVAWRQPSLKDERYIDKLKADALGSAPLAGITSASFVAAAARLYPGSGNETRNRQVFAPGAAVMHYAAENELCPYRRFKKLPEKRPEARAIDPALAEMAIAAAQGPLKLLLTWLFRMGTRITETLAVQQEWIDLDGRSVRLYDGKNDEWITLPLHPDVRALLPAAMDKGALFPWRTRGGAYKPWRKLLKGLGLAFTPHQARHTFGTVLVNMGESLDPLPHWRDPKSRARYGRPNLERQRQIMERLGAAPAKPAGRRGSKTKT